ELTVAQPEPAAQPEPVEPRTPITPREAAAPREEPPPAAPPPAAACEEQSPPAHEEAKAPKPAKSTPKRAATPKQKSAKRQTGRVTLKQTLTRAALNRLRGRDPGGFSEAQIATLVRQIESLWSEICKDAGIKPEDCSPPGRDMVAGEVDRLRRRR